MHVCIFVAMAMKYTPFGVCSQKRMWNGFYADGCGGIKRGPILATRKGVVKFKRAPAR